MVAPIVEYDIGKVGQWSDDAREHENRDINVALGTIRGREMSSVLVLACGRKRRGLGDIGRKK